MQDVGINAYTYQSKYLTGPGERWFFAGQRCRRWGSRLLTRRPSAPTMILSIVEERTSLAFGGVYHALGRMVGSPGVVGPFPIPPMGQRLVWEWRDFFIGAIYPNCRQANPNPLNLSQNFYGAYGQDTWKITPQVDNDVYGVNSSSLFSDVAFRREMCITSA